MRERIATDIDMTGQVSLTEQHHKDDVDLNVMVKRMGVTDGAIPPAAIDPRHFGDFTEAADFRTALDRTREAQQRFSELPADLRARFNNDPVRLFEFVSDPNNDAESVKLGLLSRLHATQVGGNTPPAETPPADKTPA